MAFKRTLYHNRYLTDHHPVKRFRYNNGNFNYFQNQWLENQDEYQSKIYQVYASSTPYHQGNWTSNEYPSSFYQSDSIAAHPASSGQYPPTFYQSNSDIAVNYSYEPNLFSTEYQRSAISYQSRPCYQDQFSENSVQILNRIARNVFYNAEGTYLDACNSYVNMSVEVDGVKYNGRGPNFEMAKIEAARNALDILLTGTIERAKDVIVETSCDKIGNLIFGKFYELTSNMKKYSEIGVLAGIVMVTNLDLSTATVVSLATGTKCVNGEHLSENGCAVNDSHAEIVARRCLLNFFYTNLEMMAAKNTRASIFYDPKPKKKGAKKFRLRENITLHLYISIAPCGDAKINNPRELEYQMIDKEDFPNIKMVNGMLRVKVEKMPATYPTKYSPQVQTWDGILQGQQLRTMSCSDKILKWNVLGLQGTLLSKIIEPVYLNSVTLGNINHSLDHIQSSISSRIEPKLDVQKLPQFYHLNKPNVYQVTNTGPKLPVVTPCYSINWTITDEIVEVLNPYSGKTMNGCVSRLAKQSFLRRYAKLSKHYQLPYSDNKSYGEMKDLIVEHKRAKEIFFNAFVEQDYGFWLKKPMEQDQFVLLRENAVVKLIESPRLTAFFNSPVNQKKTIASTSQPAEVSTGNVPSDWFSIELASPEPESVINMQVDPCQITETVDESKNRKKDNISDTEILIFEKETVVVDLTLSDDEELGKKNSLDPISSQAQIKKNYCKVNSTHIGTFKAEQNEQEETCVSSSNCFPIPTIVSSLGYTPNNFYNCQ